MEGGGGFKQQLQTQGHESVQRSLDNVGQLQQQSNNDAEAKTERYTNIQKLNSHHEKRSKLIVMMFFKWTL